MCIIIIIIITILETAGGASPDSLGGDSRPLLGPMASDARTAPPDSGRATMRWAAGVVYTLTAESTTGPCSAAVPRSWGKPDLFSSPLLASQAPVLLLRAGEATYDSLRSTGYCARTAPNSERAPQEADSAGWRSRAKTRATPRTTSSP